MAGAACKIIINNSVQGLMSGLERVLTHRLVRDRMMSAGECDDMIQALADLDIRTYSGTPVPCGRPQSLLEVLDFMEQRGVFTNEIWQVLGPRIRN